MKIRDSRLYDALDYLDEAYIAEVVENLKVPPAPGMPVRKGGQLRYILALAACLLVLSAAIPVITYVMRNYADLPGWLISDTTENTSPELTEPETPPSETTEPPAPETTEEVTTAFPYETTEEPWPSTTAEPEDTTSPEETTAEETTTEETTSPPEPEYDGSQGLEYKISDDGTYAILVGIGTCTDKDIVTATTYNGLPVTSVDYSFSKISNITSITLSDSVLTIGGIDNMPDLVKVYFSKSVEGINPESLIGCPNLEVIEVDKDNPKYMSSGNCLIEKATKTIVHGCKGSVIPTDGSVTIIGEFSFHGCDWLTELTIPKNIERIDAYAFAGCDNLKKVILPDSLTYLGFGAFSFCESLESIRLGNGLETLGGSVFENCPKLMELTFPKTTKLLCALAFFECKSLTKVSYEGTMAEWKAIEKTAMWSDGAAFSVIHCSDGDAELIEYDGSRGLEYRIDGDHAVLVGIGTCTDKDIVTATMYNGLPVTEIWYNAFVGVNGLTSVTISEGITYLYSCAFENCPDLKAVYLPSTLEVLEEGEAHAFYECDNIEIITVAKDNPKFYSVDNCVIEKSSGMLVFACSRSVLPTDGSIKSIGKLAFGGSDSLEKIVIPEGVTVIHPYAFLGCASLKSVTFPDSLTTIKWNAFENCTSLKSVKLGDNVTEIGSRVFSGCSSLVDITLPGRVDSFGEEIFAGCAIESIVIPDGVKNLNGGMFANCKKLKNVTLPDGIETIVSFAFAYCSSLEKITLPRSVTKIQGEVFADCSNLTEFTFKGTKAEWNAIEKQDGWNRNCPFTVIHCSDGDVSLIEYDGSQGLEYKISDDGTYAILVGIGTCTDKDIVTATMYNGLPVTEIGGGFSQIDTVRSVTVSENVTYIAGLRRCANLEEVHLPKSLSNMYIDALKSNPKLKVITIDPDNAKFSAVGNCIIEKETKTLIVGCTGSVIPSDGSVLYIGGEAFRGAGMTEITIPNGIIRFDGYAFAGCESLKSVKLPDSVTTVGYAAFSGCTSLESFEFSENTKTIGSWVFSGCTSLKEVKMPTYGSIGEGVFDDCTSLESIVIPIGQDILHIGMFSNCASLETVVLPDTLTQIHSPFPDCISLKSITIPAGVTIIEHEAFIGCKSLSEVNFKGTVAEWKAMEKENGWNRGCPFTVIHCSDGDLNIAEEVEDNGSQGLEYKISDDGKYAMLVGIGTCTDKNIVVATTYNGVPVTTIYDLAFGSDSNVTSIHISANINNIAPYAFAVNSLRSITVDAENPVYQAVGNCLIDVKEKRLVLGCATSVIPSDGSVVTIYPYAFARIKGMTSLVIPEGVEYISSYAFSGCYDLKSVTIPKSLKSIGKGAFQNCEKLVSIDLSGIEILYENTFDGCTSLRSVTGTENLTKIYPCAFRDCTSLVSFNFSDKLTLIDSLAFKNCASLKSIDIPASVTEIGQETFSGCSSLESVTIRGAVKSLYAGVFSHCSNLKNVTLSEGVKGISYYAFEYCTSLEKITLPSSITTLGEGAFYNCTALVSINIPSGITKIGSHAFSECSSLKEIDIPEGVTVIQDEAFYLCKNLKKVTLPSTLEYIRDWAFANCESLESIVIPDSVKWICSRAFSDCASLSSLTLGKELEQIQENAFMNCTSLKSVTIPGKVNYFGNAAFTGCTSLESVTLTQGLILNGTGLFGGCTRLNEIVFTGTVAEWEVTEKQNGWSDDSPIISIRCSDGDISA